MSIQLNAGQKVRIGGLEFTVQNTETKIYNKQRITGIRLEAIESLDAEDVKPSEVSENINKLLGYPLANPSEEDIKQMAQEFMPWVKSFWADLEKAVTEDRSK